MSRRVPRQGMDTPSGANGDSHVHGRGYRAGGCHSILFRPYTSAQGAAPARLRFVPKNIDALPLAAGRQNRDILLVRIHGSCVSNGAGPAADSEAVVAQGRGSIRTCRRNDRCLFPQTRSTAPAFTPLAGCEAEPPEPWFPSRAVAIHSTVHRPRVTKLPRGRTASSLCGPARGTGPAPAHQEPSTANVGPKAQNSSALSMRLGDRMVWRGCPALEPFPPAPSKRARQT